MAIQAMGETLLYPTQLCNLLYMILNKRRKTRSTNSQKCSKSRSFLKKVTLSFVPRKLLDHLTILFSKVDSRHYELADANKQILADLKVLKLERESNSNSGDKGLVDLFAESSSENE